MISQLRRLMKSRRGAIATEFALVAPIMITLWIGIVEFASAHLAARKVETAAQSAADLIAQETTISDPQIAEIVLAVNELLAPGAATPPTIGWDISSIEADSEGTRTVGWNRSGGTLAGATGHTAAMGENLATGNDSVIVVTVGYTHQPLLVDFILGPVPFSETVFARPRRVPVIPIE